MKFEQLRYTLAVYETGSITKAAKKLYLSQPNISNSLKSLEAELGFELFERETGGVKFTEKGMAFVRHCQNILDEVDQINVLAGQEKRLDFTLLYASYPPVEAAFAKLCNEVMEHERYHLVLRIAHQYEAFRLISENKADMAMIFSTNITSHTMRMEMEKAGLEYVHLAWLPCNVNLSKNHPLAHDPEFSVSKLIDYPVVNYDFSGYKSPYGQMSDMSFVSTGKMLRASDGDTRSYLIAHTNAYGIGAQMAPGTAEQKGLCCIPIPKEKVQPDFGYLYAKARPLGELARRYLALLKEEMAFLGENAPADQP